MLAHSNTVPPVEEFGFSVTDNVIISNNNRNLNHPNGSGVRSLSRDISFITIPKNASSIVSWVLIYYLKWEQIPLFDKSMTANNIVILRDPLERWMSGVAEFLSRTGFKDLSEQVITDMLRNPAFDQILINAPYFDEHTIPQVSYLHNLPLPNITFFKLTECIVTDILEYLNIDPVTPPQQENSKIKKLIKNELMTKIAEDPLLAQIIKDQYAEDYQLIDMVDITNVR